MMTMKNGDDDDEELLDDMIELILLSLPYKSLVRFKTVSKLWNYFISQPSFIHKRYIYNNKCSTSFIVAHTRLATEKIRYFTHLPSVSYTDGKLSTTNNNENDVERFIIPSINGSSIYNSVLISSVGFGVYGLFDLCKRKVYLWNPSMREMKALPLLPSHFRKRDEDEYVYGFAHVEYKDNTFSYKVGMMREMYDIEDGQMYYCFKIDVYSSIDNLWKPSIHKCRFLRSGELHSMSCNSTYSGTVLNGKFHFLNWLCEEDVHIITFDMCTQVFERLEIPNSIPEDSNVSASILTTIDDDKFLCLAIRRGEYDEQQSVDVWIMCEYGEAKSWKKVSTAGPVSEPAYVEILPVNNHAGGMFFHSGEYGDGLFFMAYGSEKAETVLPVSCQDLEMLSMVEYTESLVSF